MGPKKKNDIPPEKLALYEKLIATNPRIERKGATNPYTSLNGHMFTHMDPSGSLGIRPSERGNREVSGQVQDHAV